MVGVGPACISRKFFNFKTSESGFETVLASYKLVAVVSEGG